MRFTKPSPSMVVASIALFIALGGTSVAAVTYARNAGAVDGKSAVASSATLSSAAGKLVATASKGPNKGRIPSKFITGVPRATTFGASVAVTDNQVGSPANLGGLEGTGTLTASCADQNKNAGVEDPITTVTFNNTSGTTINIAKRIGGGGATVVAQPAATVQTIDIGGSNTFELHVQNANVDLVVNGVVRQDGRGTAEAACLFYGTLLQVG